ncbi:hypothetical protein [Haloferax sp. ATB1]|uniref:hypothetical protein n=1 Tax=Haloferax sp. ATB1 TaxID=1508454 RepID=UPI000ACE0F73|nr:hypothetical protein [Haloferax sp. ATB1]
MNRRTFLGGVGTSVVLLSGCLGTEGNALDPAADQNDDPAGDEQPARQATDSPEPTPEPTTEQPAEPTPESTPEPTTDAPEDRIDFEREDDDPDVVGTLLTKGPVPGVVVSSDLPYAKAWQNYAETDEEAGDLPRRALRGHRLAHRAAERRRSGVRRRGRSRRRRHGCEQQRPGG